MEGVYTTFEREVKRRKIKKCAIAEALGITYKTLRLKLRGEYGFTWDEVCRLQQVFFPDMEKDELMERRA